MTIEEAIQAAEAGDIGAMLALGDAAQKDFKLREAYEWYERAANLGDAFGMALALLSRSMFALGCEGIGDYEGALESWYASYNWAKILLDNSNISKENKEVAISNHSRILSGIGSCFWALKRNNEAVEPLEIAVKEGDLRARVVLGLNHYRLMTEQDFQKRTKLSIPLLESVFDPDIMLSNNSHLDQRILYMSHRFLEEAYRKGLGGLSPDITKAYECLLHLEAQNLKDYGEEVQAALSKYRKGMLGGYKYIG